MYALLIILYLSDTYGGRVHDKPIGLSDSNRDHVILTMIAITIGKPTTPVNHASDNPWDTAGHIVRDGNNGQAPPSLRNPAFLW